MWINKQKENVLVQEQQVYFSSKQHTPSSVNSNPSFRVYIQQTVICVCAQLLHLL